jgi:integrase
VARGEAVIRYQGKTAVTWRIKYRDTAGRQVLETLKPGDAPKGGWNRKRAQAALAVRISEVKRERWTKPEKLTFAGFAERFEAEALPGRNLKPSTLIDYRSTLRLHLVPFFGGTELVAVDAATVDAYIASKTGSLSPKTISNHLGLLRLMFRTAMRWRLVLRSPLDDVDVPRPDSPEMNILTEAEIGRLLTGYRQLEAAPPAGTTVAEWRQARRIVTVALGTGLRRGELLALRWRDIQLLEGVLSVRESYVRGQFQSPKSRKSKRAFGLGPITLAALDEQWQETVYKTDADLVFCHLQLGSPLDPSRLSKVFLRPTLTTAAITKPFRVWHDLRHTALTHDAAAGNPQAYVQMKAGHSQGAITERYIHAAAVMFPGAADKAEARLFAGLTTEEERDSSG